VTRKSINVPGLAHGKNPTPAACLLHNLLVTGAIFGRDRSTGKLAEGLEQQCAHMFANAALILEAAGAGWADVAKMTFFLRPGASREVINAEWVKVFPDEASRPARHVLVSDTLPEGMLVQCDILAVLAGD
jgi:enamine deaminase RidA (YjgF/YER057c/UK114 family)